eukprot:4791879-Prymnesium_polylepis.6
MKRTQGARACDDDRSAKKASNERTVPAPSFEGEQHECSLSAQRAQEREPPHDAWKTSVSREMSSSALSGDAKSKCARCLGPTHCCGRAPAFTRATMSAASRKGRRAAIAS